MASEKRTFMVCALAICARRSFARRQRGVTLKPVIACLADSGVTVVGGAGAAGAAATVTVWLATALLAPSESVATSVIVFAPADVYLWSADFVVVPAIVCVVP